MYFPAVEDRTKKPETAVDALRTSLQLDIGLRVPFLEHAKAIMQVEDHDRWLLLFSHGFVQVVLDMLFEVEFIGNTIADLHSFREDVTLNRGYFVSS